MIFLLLVFAFFAVPVGASAGEITVDREDHVAEVIWNDKVNQGDAVFVRVALRATGSTAASLVKTAGTLVYTKNNSSAIYLVPSRPGKPVSGTGYAEFLAGFPLSTREKPGTYVAALNYRPSGTGGVVSVDLPFIVTAKDFPTDTVHLDKGTTAIMNDKSPERTEQSERFNKIVGAKNRDAVHQQAPFAKPTTGTYITSPFGDRRIYAYSDGTSYTSEHWGIDYRAPEGTPVYACAAGKVVMAENRILTGGTVLVEHLPGLYSCYYHQSKLFAKVGDMVKPGDTVGEAGSTGVATGPHIHWEIKLNSQYVNPDFFRENFAFY